MALTQDQAEMLQTAVDNLNQSVEVNKQVLEVVRSVGNTGAVDIAEHNNDPEAHSSGFDNLFVKETFFLGSNSLPPGKPYAVYFTGTDLVGAIKGMAA